MFKCKEVYKCNPQSLATLSFIVCHENDININCTENILFKSEPINVIYKNNCKRILKPYNEFACCCSHIHNHIEHWAEHRYYTLRSGRIIDEKFLVLHVYPFNEYNHNVEQSRKRKANSEGLDY